MGTFLDLQNNVATDLTRTDLTSQIKSAIGDAVKHYEHDRFWFNVTRTKTFQTVIGQTSYGVADLADIPNIIRIDHLFLPVAGSVYDLCRQEPDEFEWLASVYLGKPTDYTYADGQILLWPIPGAIYTLRPHMHYRLAPLALDTDSNAWCNEAEQLIRAHAKLLLYTNLLEDAEGAQRMQGEVQAFKDNLNYETSARTATGRIRAPDGHF